MDSDCESVMSEPHRSSKKIHKGGTVEKESKRDGAEETFMEKYNYLIGYVIVLVLLVLVFVGGYNFVKKMRKKRNDPESKSREADTAEWSLTDEVRKLEDRQRILLSRPKVL